MYPIVKSLSKGNIALLNLKNDVVDILQYKNNRGTYYYSIAIE